MALPPMRCIILAVHILRMLSRDLDFYKIESRVQSSELNKAAMPLGIISANNIQKANNSKHRFILSARGNTEMLRIVLLLFFDVFGDYRFMKKRFL